MAKVELRDRVKRQRVRPGIERGYGFGGGAVEGARVNDPAATRTFVAPAVGVAVQNIVYLQTPDRRIERGFMTVKHGKSLAIEGQT